MASGEVAPSEWIAHLHSMRQAHEVAKKGYIAYLKQSGERIGDLRNLPVDELRDWFNVVREQHERDAKRRQELLERVRRNGRR